MRLWKLLIEKDFEIKKLTSFKIGGKIAKVYFPETVDEFLQALDAEPEAYVAGNLSNTLVCSDGFDGALILTAKLDDVKINGNNILAQAGVKGPKLAQIACENALSGLEFLIGFPGSVGGEIFMNASANGQVISDYVKSVKVFDREKGVLSLNKSDMEFDYRTSICQKKNYTVLEAEFELIPSPSEEIKKRMDANLDFRKSHQPLLNLPNCGSVFRNPQGYSAGKLLDECGFRGKRCGGVKVWDNHANFIVNDNNGTSDDVLNLMLEMKSKVKEKFGIELNSEICFLGEVKL